MVSRLFSFLKRKFRIFNLLPFPPTRHVNHVPAFFAKRTIESRERSLLSRYRTPMLRTRCVRKKTKDLLTLRPIKHPYPLRRYFRLPFPKILREKKKISSFSAIRFSLLFNATYIWFKRDRNRLSHLPSERENMLCVLVHFIASEMLQRSSEDSPRIIPAHG